MNRLTLVLAVIVAALLSGCGADGATSGVAGSGAPTSSPTPVAGGTGGPAAAASQSPEKAAAALVPAIDPTHAVRTGTTRGAFAVVVLSDAGRTQATGQAECTWDRALDPPTFDSLATSPVNLFGEEVTVGYSSGLTLDREVAARYIPVGGLTWDPTTVNGATVARSTDLEVDTGAAVPDGADPSAYGASLGGRADTTSLDVTVAWRCEPTTAAPDASAPTGSAEEPTPVCPPRVPGSPAPVGPLTLHSGSDEVDGSPFSSSWVTCDGSDAADGDWSVPDTQLAVSRATPLTLSLDGQGTLFDVAAFYTRASADTTPTNMLTLAVHPGSSPNTFRIDPPPPGDWALVISAGIADPDHGQVTNGTFIYRLKVSR